MPWRSEGSFDDCQRLAKEAFRDPALEAAAAADLGELHQHRPPASPVPVLPLCRHAARRARRRGARPSACPAATSATSPRACMPGAGACPSTGSSRPPTSNDVVPLYLQSGRFDPRAVRADPVQRHGRGQPQQFRASPGSLRGELGRDGVPDRRPFGHRRRGRWRRCATSTPSTACSWTRTRPWAARQRVTTWSRGPAGAERARSSCSPPRTRQSSPTSCSVPTGVAPEMPERLARCLALPKQSRRVGTSLLSFREFLAGTRSR